MNLDELQSVQARERQSSDLQHLRSSFYREVGEFIEELDEERARAVEAADDPFSDPEIRRLTDDIETAKSTVEAIYERRVGKVVKKASIAAADMPVEEDGLTDEEAALFENLVTRIEENREAVLSVLDGDAPSVSCSIDDEGAPDAGPVPDPETASPSDAPTPAATGEAPKTPTADPEEAAGVSAADLMGESDGADAEDEAPNRTASTGETPSAGDDDGSGESGSRVETAESSTETGAEAGAGSNAPPEIPRATVRITADVGQIVGADDRDYELGSEDVVTLPEPNANVLVEKDAAERLSE